MYLQGTTYAPKADINLTLSNFGAQVMRFGLIARQVEFDINNGNPRYTGPVFEIPDNTYVLGFQNNVVELIVRVCMGETTVTAACKASDPVLRSRVQIWDESGQPVIADREMRILSWSRSS